MFEYAKKVLKEELENEKRIQVAEIEERDNIEARLRVVADVRGVKGISKFLLLLIVLEV